MRNFLPLVLSLLLLLSMIGAWILLYGNEGLFENFFGQYPWNISGPSPSYTIPLRPDKFSLLLGMIGSLALLVEPFVPKSTSGARTTSARLLLLVAAWGLFPIFVRLSAVAMALITLLLIASLIVGAAWGLNRLFTRRENDHEIDEQQSPHQEPRKNEPKTEN